MMDLNAFPSQCQPNQSIIVSAEKGRKHTANNVESCDVRHFRIDGVVIPDRDVKKCDYLLLNDSKHDAYFIELKGTDIKSAMEQIDSAVSLLVSQMPRYTIRPRIVCSGNTHAIRDRMVIRWKQKYRNTAIVKTGQYEENI